MQGHATALHIAAHDSAACTRALLRAGASPHAMTEPRKWTPLFFARDVATAEALLAAGAELEAKDMVRADG